ncbi:hypothetical protein [Flavobacterium sp.]|uniref:hypothetical protein n=1 Tax=Flavobacterium sp. TaxID=239 RepID=UPI002616B7F6|nr:hypothetical protein [Flavobacterium sp.]
MKKLLLFALLFVSAFSFSQTTKLKLPNLENEFEVKLEKNINDGVDILITDSKNSGVSWRMTEEKDTPVADFTRDVFAKISETKDYYLKIPKTDKSLKLSKDDAGDIKFKKSLTDSKEDYISFLKANTRYNNDIDKTTFKKYLDKIAKKDDTVAVFINNNNYYFKKGDDKKISLFFKETLVIEIPISIEDENKFYEDFFKKYGTNITIVDSNLLINGDLKIASTSINYDIDENSKKLEEIYIKVLDKSEYSLINNFYVTDTVAKKSKVISVSVKNNFKENYFKLKVCNKDYQCKEPIQMPYDIDKSQFKTDIKTFLLEDFDSGKNTINDIDLESLYNAIKKNSEKKVIDENSKELKKEIASLAEQIDNIESQYSGILKLNKEIRVYSHKGETNFVGGEKQYKKLQLIEDNNFIVDYATVRFFNNKAKEIVVVGKLKKSIKGRSDENQEFITINFQHSIRLRSLNNSIQYVPISPNDDDADKMFISFNDLLQYYPYESTYNYSVRNKEYRIKANDTVKVEQKKLMDYFTAVIFSDVLGLNNENANGLLQAEGRIKVPLWIANRKYFSIFNSLNADVNATIYNGFDDSSRFITPVNNNKPDIDSLVVNNFDYIKFNNINAGIGFSLVNLELKGLSSEVSLGYGVRYYRAGLRYTLEKDSTDVVKNYQLNALTHEFNVNLEIRPQINFGADLNVAYNWLNARGSTGDLPIVLNKEDKNDDKQVLRFQLNLYSKINPDKTNDGIYARLGGFYHFGTKDFYPQLLIGYATNLSSFVNKFKK